MNTEKVLKMAAQVVLAPVPLCGIKEIRQEIRISVKMIKWAAAQEDSPIIVTGEAHNRRYHTEYNRLFEWLKNNIHRCPDKI